MFQYILEMIPIESSFNKISGLNYFQRLFTFTFLLMLNITMRAEKKNQSFNDTIIYKFYQVSITDTGLLFSWDAQLSLKVFR